MILWIFIGSILFAEDTNTENPLPKNIVSVDVGTVGYTLLLSGIYNFSGLHAVYFGTGIQYERQLSGYLSLAGRLGYIGIFGLDTGSNISSFSAEGHIRYYPQQDTFFLDGMLGYGNFITQFDSRKTVLSHYLTVGGKLGWRIDFDKPGGLILEPSFGYYGAIGRTNISNEPSDDDFWENFFSFFEYMMLDSAAKFIDERSEIATALARA